MGALIYGRDLITNRSYSAVMNSPTPFSSSNNQPNPLVGRVMDQYEIVDVIATGGMGVVYKARHTLTDRVVAIKLLPSELARDSSNVDRLKLEAKALAQLSHPNIVTTFDFGFSAMREPYIVIEYVDGESLKEILEREVLLPIDRAVPLFVQIVDAMRFAHANKILHRDLKPHNIMVSNQPEVDHVKVLDFGVAKMVEDAQSITRTGEVVGSPLYMSPEQCVGKPYDHRCDIYSVGVVMYEALTGTVPYRGENYISTVHLKCTKLAPAFKDVVPGRAFPKQLETIVLRCLEVESEKRYPSMLDLKAELELVANSIPKVDRPQALAQSRSTREIHPSTISSDSIISSVSDAEFNPPTGAGDPHELGWQPSWASADASAKSAPGDGKEVSWESVPPSKPGEWSAPDNVSGAEWDATRPPGTPPPLPQSGNPSNGGANAGAAFSAAAQRDADTLGFTLKPEVKQTRQTQKWNPASIPNDEFGSADLEAAAAPNAVPNSAAPTAVTVSQPGGTPSGPGAPAANPRKTHGLASLSAALEASTMSPDGIAISGGQQPAQGGEGQATGAVQALFTNPANTSPNPEHFTPGQSQAASGSQPPFTQGQPVPGQPPFSPPPGHSASGSQTPFTPPSQAQPGQPFPQTQGQPLPGQPQTHGQHPPNQTHGAPAPFGQSQPAPGQAPPVLVDPAVNKPGGVKPAAVQQQPGYAVPPSTALSAPAAGPSFLAPENTTVTDPGKGGSGADWRTDPEWQPYQTNSNPVVTGDHPQIVTPAPSVGLETDPRAPVVDARQGVPGVPPAPAADQWSQIAPSPHPAAPPPAVSPAPLMPPATPPTPAPQVGSVLRGLATTGQHNKPGMTPPGGFGTAIPPAAAQSNPWEQAGSGATSAEAFHEPEINDAEAWQKTVPSKPPTWPAESGDDRSDIQHAAPPSAHDDDDDDEHEVDLFALTRQSTKGFGASDESDQSLAALSGPEWDDGSAKTGTMPTTSMPARKGWRRTMGDGDEPTYEEEHRHGQSAHSAAVRVGARSRGGSEKRTMMIGISVAIAGVFGIIGVSGGVLFLQKKLPFQQEAATTGSATDAAGPVVDKKPAKLQDYLNSDNEETASSKSGSETPKTTATAKEPKKGKGTTGGDSAVRPSQTAVKPTALPDNDAEKRKKRERAIAAAKAKKKKQAVAKKPDAAGEQPKRRRAYSTVQSYYGE